MMKQEYTQYSFFINNNIKTRRELGHIVTWEMIVEKAKINIKNNPVGNEKFNQINSIIIAENVFKKAKCSQYFINDLKLFKFITNSVKSYQTSLVDILPTGGILNFPVEWNLPSFIFVKGLSADKRTNLIFVNLSNKNTLLSSASFIVDDSSDLINDPVFMDKLAKGETIHLACKFIFGLSLYLKCFPCAVRDGLPDNCLHPNHYKFSEINTVSIAPEILDSSDRTVTPHIRSGHFKLLGSDFYKKMKGQVIFISECFVKGTAKTVEDINERKLINE